MLRRGARRLIPGAYDFLRGDLTAAVVVSDGHARYQEAVLAGNVYIGSNPSGTPVTTQAGVSATTPALTLFNPHASTVNLVLWAVDINITTEAAAAFMLAYNPPLLAGVPTGPVTLTNANITNAILGQGIPGTTTVVSTQGGNQGQCFRAATLSAAPIAFRYLGRHSFTAAGSGAGAASASPDAFGGMPGSFPIDGEIVIPPGVAMSIQATAAVAITCAFTWEEVPLN